MSTVSRCLGVLVAAVAMLLSACASVAPSGGPSGQGVVQSIQETQRGSTTGNVVGAIGGALVGGALMIRIGLWRALMLYGVLQMLSNLGFWWLAVSGKGVIPGTTLPAFDWGFVALAAPTPVDGGLLMVVAFENLSGGMGTAAFVAFLMSLCNQRFTATQFALLSAFASVGRVWVGPLAGVLAESIGWPTFFVVSTVLAAPALVMLWWLRASVLALEVPPQAASMAED